MALIKLGGLAQDVRGSLNGTVFSRNRGGAYVRTKVSPVQPVTEFNSLSRQFFGSISQRWSQELTDSQRAGWSAFAATHPFVNVFGDASVLSGLAFYMSVNRRILEVGEAYIDDAPASFNVADLGVTTAVFTALAGALTSAVVTIGRALEYNEGIYLFGTAPLLGARAAYQNSFRLVNSPDSGLFTNSQDIFAEYNLRFDPLPFASGDRLAVRVAVLDIATGAISSPALIPVEVG